LRCLTRAGLKFIAVVATATDNRLHYAPQVRRCYYITDEIITPKVHVADLHLALRKHAPHRFAQSLQVTPDYAKVDETVTVRASGLQPSENIAIRVDLVDGAGKRWTSEGRFLRTYKAPSIPLKRGSVGRFLQERFERGPNLVHAASREKHTGLYTTSGFGRPAN
jgi:hypothetical protein